MEMAPLANQLWSLNPNERREIYRGIDGTIVTATRTDKICPHDFKAGLLKKDRDEFYPTHVRLLFDLYLKRISNTENFLELYSALDEVYDGSDPEEVANTKNLSNLDFDMQLDTADVNIYYAQLLMIEQEFNYGPKGCKKGKVQPPREFLMRFIRWIASGESEIDRIITCAVRNYPPPKKFKTPEKPQTSVFDDF